MTAPQPRPHSDGIADTLMFQRFATEQDPKVSVFSRAWFWAAVVVVVTAVAVAVILLTR